MPQKFCHLFQPFYELFCQSSGHKTFKTACLWSLVVVLEWDSILQEQGKWSGAKKISAYREKYVKQSQKRYMVSGSLCHLISFLDVSYLVSNVVRGQRPRRGR